MNNLIFGSGVVGLLAREILGSDWKIIPFYRSRFFSFNPSLDDNFIICDEYIDDFIKDLTGVTSKLLYPRVWSARGELVKEWDDGLCDAWLYKVFGSDIPAQVKPYMSNRMVLPVYGGIRINSMYEELQARHIDALKEEVSKGQVSEIGDHYIVRDGVKEEFDNAVSTIPLDALLGLMGQKHNLKSKTVHYHHIETGDLDFEGANQVLVTDDVFSFYKSTNVAKDRFLMYCHEEIQNPGLYYMNFMQQFDIIDGTSIAGAIPLGQIPNVEAIENRGIYCVGSSAEWDWCADVGSNVLRLLKYSSRGNKPKQ